MKQYIYDPEILEYTTKLQIRITHVKITLLNRNDIPIKSLEGITTSGSITLNGSSSVRRSGSVSFILPQDPIHSENTIAELEDLFFLNKRISLEIGLENTGGLYPEYDMFWFPLGRFIITQPQISKNLNNGIQVSLTLNDKMSLLNGTCGGVIGTSLIHSPIDVVQTSGEIVKEFPLIYDLIYAIIVDAAEIPADQVIISDIPKTIKTQVFWSATDTDAYIYQENNKQCISTIEPLNNNTVSHKTFGEVIGYQNTGFTFPTDKELTSNAGETITSILDKIKNTLGNFEYFFDTDGIFRFQEIKNYLNDGSAIDNLTNAINDKYFQNLSNIKSVYTFRDNKTFTAISNTPSYKDIKNDIVVWGKHAASGVPIRYHLLIDNKPALSGIAYWASTYIDTFGNTRAIDVKTNDPGSPYELIMPTDWRQALYLYNKANGIQTFLAREIDEEIPKILDIKTGSFFYDAAPENLMYYIDILDPNYLEASLKDSIQDISIANIGSKLAVISDETINCIFAPTFNEDFVMDKEVDGYELLKDFIGIGTTTNPAFDTVRSALHTYIGYNNTISITSIPIYHLEPNSRITIEGNDDIKINGDYMITNMTIPLTAKGTMTISATKALERI